MSNHAKITGLKNMVLCGLTGVGKSSIVNMLVQGDIYRDKDNACAVGNNANGTTKELEGFFTSEFKVIDTAGLGELSTGTIPNEEAVNQMRNHFSQSNFPLHYICYVRSSKVTSGDAECFETFKKVFRGGESNFVIIVTNTGSKWANDQQNIKSIKETFGNYPIISVDFPFNEDERYFEVDKKVRQESLEHLRSRLSGLNCEKIILEVLTPSQDFESKLSPFINLVPVAGSMYQLTASGVYYCSGLPNEAKQRLKAGATGFVVDAASIGFAGLGRPVIAVAGVAAGVAGKGGKAAIDYVKNNK